MRNSFRTWMLPEGVVEALPDEAIKLNSLEQTALTTFSRWGYQPLRPPMMEYSDTFISDDRNGDLSEQTIQFKDQKSGKQLGFRADITPQIARIDAHYLKTDKVARYAYVGEVVRSYPTGHGSVRNPTVVGAELLGSSSTMADVEIVSLLIEYLKQIGLPSFVIELGNIDIAVALLKAVGVETAHFSLFFDALAKKDNEKLRTLCEKRGLSVTVIEQVNALTRFFGERETLDAAMSCFSAYDSVLAEIRHLADIADRLQSDYTDVKLVFDISDVRGYGYHNGLIFSAFVDGLWQSVARGGRYDGFGNHFGEATRQRASIGFNCHLNLLTRAMHLPKPVCRVIACDLNAVNDEQRGTLQQYLSALRDNGDTVVCLFDDAVAPVMDYTHQVAWQNGQWCVKTCDNS